MITNVIINKERFVGLDELLKRLETEIFLSSKFQEKHKHSNSEWEKEQMTRYYHGKIVAYTDLYHELGGSGLQTKRMKNLGSLEYHKEKREQ